MLKKGKIVDLSMPISPYVTPVSRFPKPFSAALRWHAIDNPLPGYSIQWHISWIAMAAHTATHIDAPFHMLKEGMKLCDIPIDRYTGDALCLDVTPKKALSRITLDDLEKAERKAESPLQKGDIVLVYTGWGDKWDRMEPVDFNSNHPFYEEEAAKWLVSRGIKTHACDLPNLENPVGWSADHEFSPIHATFFRNDIPNIENLVNLGNIAGKRVLFVGAPLKLLEVPDGCPIRAIAILEP